VIKLKKLLIVGHNGQLGSEITRNFKSKDNGIDFLKNNNMTLVKLSSKELDITNNIHVLSYIRDIKPHIIINCAAYTNVDQAEEDYEEAFQVNALGPRNLAIAAESVGAKLIHVSTDYVFDGRGVLSSGEVIPYREYDVANPINVYGKTKLLGENYVREFCSKYFIIRTSWLYGENGNNFVKTIIKAAREKGKLQVVNDQIGNPTNAEDLAEHIYKIAFTDEYGIYHCTGNGICSWYDFACKIVQYAGIDCDIEPVSSEKYVTKAKRPSYSFLDNMMLRNTSGDTMRNWEEALYDFIKNRLKL
jgi:dTDP-4-dehydrorhamnose reductase